MPNATSPAARTAVGASVANGWHRGQGGSSSVGPSAVGLHTSEAAAPLES